MLASLSSFFLAWAALPQQPPLPAAEPAASPWRVQDLCWRPWDGHSLALIQDAGDWRLLRLDPWLQPVAEAAGVGIPPQRLAASGFHWLLQGEDGRWQAWAGAGIGTPALAASAVPGPGWTLWTGPTPLLADPALEVAASGRRRLRWHPEAAELRLELAPWEHAGEIQWGPGWACLRFRSVRPMGPYVEWRREDGATRLLPVMADPSDPIWQKVYFEPIQPGMVLEFRHAPVRWVYPNRAWSPWRSLKVPEVLPGGERPLQVLGEETEPLPSSESELNSGG
ncbi:MAG: hypothetical protein DWQ01_22485 [Planctomycetota bacterium]|nr:MAG: hypothetical protein DWQ01_22485 [Planctomycetota bacterium]